MSANNISVPLKQSVEHFSHVPPTRMRLKAAVENLPRTEADMRRLLHELQVHQIEQEMQNEELLQAR